MNEPVSEIAPAERAASREEEFVRLVAKLYPDDRGRLATLRRAAGKSLAEAPNARWIYRWTTQLHFDDRDDDLLLLVATLIASHKKTYRDKNLTSKGNAGTTMAAIRNGGGLSKPSADLRMRILLDAQFDGEGDLPHHLLRLVSLADSNDVAIGWPRLIEDLRHWNDESRSVQKAWAKAYFAAPDPAATPDSTTGDERTATDAS